MEGLRKPVAVYLVAVAVVVGVYFALNAVLEDTISSGDVWQVLDWFMAVGLVLAFAYSYVSERREASDAGGAVGRGFLEARVGVYLTLFVGLLFFHNWFTSIVDGEITVAAEEVLWALSDSGVAVALAWVGCHLWRTGAR